MSNTVFRGFTGGSNLIRISEPLCSVCNALNWPTLWNG